MAFANCNTKQVFSNLFYRSALVYLFMLVLVPLKILAQFNPNSPHFSAELSGQQKLVISMDSANLGKILILNQNGTYRHLATRKFDVVIAANTNIETNGLNTAQSSIFQKNISIFGPGIGNEAYAGIGHIFTSSTNESELIFALTNSKGEYFNFGMRIEPNISLKKQIEQIHSIEIMDTYEQENIKVKVMQVQRLTEDGPRYDISVRIHNNSNNREKIYSRRLDSPSEISATSVYNEFGNLNVVFSTDRSQNSIEIKRNTYEHVNKVEVIDPSQSIENKSDKPLTTDSESKPSQNVDLNSKVEPGKELTLHVQGVVNAPDLPKSYILINDDSGVRIRRLADGKEAYFTNFGVGQVTVQIDGDLVYLGLGRDVVSRSISLKHFDLEAQFKPKDSKNVQTPEGPKNPFSILHENFEAVNPEHIKNYYFSPSEEELLKDIQRNLKKSGRKSLVLLGESGRGKTVLLEKALKNLPPTWAAFKVDRLSLESGAKYVGTSEARVKAIIEASKVAPIVLFMDEFHALTDAGKHANNKISFLEMLKTSLADGSVIIFGTDTKDEYVENVTDPALRRRISEFELPKLTHDEEMMKVKSWIKIEGYSDIEEALLKHANKLAREFNPSEEEPSRTINLLDVAYNLKDENTEPLTKEDIDKAVKKIYRLDPSTREFGAMKQKLKDFPRLFQQSVIGLDNIRSLLIERTQSALMGFHTGVGPRISILLTGEHGVGKTLAARTYAKALGLSYLEIEMNRYNDHGLNPELLMKEIADQLRKDPFSVIVLDEIEKSSIRAQEALLKIMSNDRFTAMVQSNTGNTRSLSVFSRNATIIATTNAGWEQIKEMRLPSKQSIGFTSQKGSDAKSLDKKGIKELVKEKMSVALVDRFRDVEIAHFPDVDGARKIVLLTISNKLKAMNKNNLTDTKWQAKDVASFANLWANKIINDGMNLRDAIPLIETEIENKSTQLAFSDQFEAGKKQKISLGLSCQKIFSK